MQYLIFSVKGFKCISLKLRQIFHTNTLHQTDVKGLTQTLEEPTQLELKAWHTVPEAVIRMGMSELHGILDYATTPTSKIVMEAKIWKGNYFHFLGT